MFRKDNFIYGLVAGLFLPSLAWCYESCFSSAADQKQLVLLISLGLNLLLVRLAYKREWPLMANGIMLITFLSALALFYFKHHA